MYVLDTPWDLALASLAATLRLTYAIDGMAIYFGPDRTATLPLDHIPARVVSRWELSERRLDKLGADDLRLAGKHRQRRYRLSLYTPLDDRHRERW